MKVLLTGGSSLLGQELARTAPCELWSTWYTVHQPWCQFQLDVSNKSQVAYVIGRVNPDIIIHAAAIGSVDWAQQNYRETWQVNVEGTRNVMEAAGGARFIYLSSNAVYSGDDPPYKEDSPREPVNAYGKMRKRAEDFVMSECRGPWAILRLFLLYGWPPKGARGNWPLTVIDKLRKGETVKAATDKVYQPTYAPDAAKAIWQLMGQEGCWNLAGREACTFFGLAMDTAEAFGLDETLILPVPSSAFTGMAPRPNDSSYDTTKAREFGIELPGYKEGLERMRKDEP